MQPHLGAWDNNTREYITRLPISLPAYSNTGLEGNDSMLAAGWPTNLHGSPPPVCCACACACGCWAWMLGLHHQTWTQTSSTCTVAFCNRATPLLPHLLTFGPQSQSMSNGMVYHGCWAVALGRRPFCHTLCGLGLVGQHHSLASYTKIAVPYGSRPI